ncbi:uncharacterized protein N7477_009411 [Penicillium maclennaniae]|uniref:uncharacterized protein n=1 Tax=Penicillium maclennaniae TaxID=1343394 RepID=UPI00254198F4|nr:uncharacterized protein N7477_009411 [Penicillium maclennaniae]KAJ5661795.1 hypothetical protein N7477_009411 [Penicillium maclennaniae]
MWRDRTNLYISYRQSFAHHPSKKPRFLGPSNGFETSAQPEESRRLISETGGFEDDGDMVIEMDLLPPRWVDIQEEVSEHLADIALKSSQLDKLHQKHLLPGFGDEDLRRKRRGPIKRIETMVRDSKQQGGVSNGEETMAKNIQISLAARVQESSARFRKKQSTYLRKLRDLEGFSTPFDHAPTPVQNPYTDPSLMESDADKSFSQTMLQQTSQRHTGQNDAAIAQREREINDIAKGIIELSDIFRELQSMIIDQGTMLDRIDYNVERMGTEVKAADKELKVATNYQKRTTKRKVMILLALVVIGLIIVLVVKPKRSSAPPPPVEESSNNIRSLLASEARARRYSLSSRFARDRWMDPHILR